jgi:hypothetical protein
VNGNEESSDYASCREESPPKRFRGFFRAHLSTFKREE